MGMRLDEVIQRYNDNAEYERAHGFLQGYLEFRQLAKWLEELRAYRTMNELQLRIYSATQMIEPQESEG